MIIASPKVTIRNMNQSVREKARVNTFLCHVLTDVVDFYTRFSPKLELTDMRDAECVQEIANFSQVLFPPISFRVTKKQAIYMDVTYSLHISFIYSYISPFISFRVTKSSLYLYICTSHTLSKYFSHFLSHINILIFTPFSFRGTKKQPILMSHIFSLCVSYFF